MSPKYEKLFDEEIKEFIRISETFAQENVGDSVEELRQNYNELVKHFRKLDLQTYTLKIEKSPLKRGL